MIGCKKWAMIHDCCVFAIFCLSISSVLTPLALYLEMISLHSLWPVFFVALHSLTFILDLRTFFTYMTSFWAERLSSTLYLLSAFTTTSATSVYKSPELLHVCKSCLGARHQEVQKGRRWCALVFQTDTCPSRACRLTQATKATQLAVQPCWLHGQVEVGQQVPSNDKSMMHCGIVTNKT